jgi:orotate phosphoribosyltransferase
VIKIASLADLIIYLNDAPELASYKSAVEAYRAQYGV